MIVQSQIVRFRVTPRVRDAIEEFARRNHLPNKTGAPNLSGAVRTIVELAASDGSYEEVYRIAYANARADLIQKVTGRFGTLLDELSKL